MYLEIYIDILFLINLVMDYFLLALEKRILKWNTRRIRMIMASVLGAFATCVFAILPSLYGEVKFVISYIVICALMIRISFRTKKIKELIRGVVVLYLITNCVGGVITSLYYQRETLLYYADKLMGRLFGKMNLVSVAILGTIAMACILIIVRFLKHQNQMTKEIYEVWLTRDGVCVHTMGLVDTGNCLFDPITGKPVIVIEMKLMEEALEPSLYHDLKKIVQFEDTSYHINSENATKIRLIPFQSIGKKRGILPAIFLDEVEIRKDTQFLCSKRVIAALYDDVLSQSKEYQVILHKSLL